MTFNSSLQLLRRRFEVDDVGGYLQRPLLIGFPLPLALLRELFVEDRLDPLLDRGLRVEGDTEVGQDLPMAGADRLRQELLADLHDDPALFGIRDGRLAVRSEDARIHGPRAARLLLGGLRRGFRELDRRVQSRALARGLRLGSGLLLLRLPSLDRRGDDGLVELRLEFDEVILRRSLRRHLGLRRDDAGALVTDHDGLDLCQVELPTEALGLVEEALPERLGDLLLDRRRGEAETVGEPIVSLPIHRMPTDVRGGRLDDGRVHAGHSTLLVHKHRSCGDSCSEMCMYVSIVYNNTYIQICQAISALPYSGIPSLRI